MTDEHLCKCGSPQTSWQHYEHDSALPLSARHHLFEAAPSTDEGEGQGDVTLIGWWERYDRNRASRVEVEAAIRAPLEEERDRLRAHVGLLRQGRDAPAWWAGHADFLRARAEAAEERIRELEAVAFHTDGIMHIATERIETLEAENERLREALEEIVEGPDHTGGAHWRIERARRALATPPASTEDDGTQVPE